MRALVIHVWAVELAPTEWMGWLAAVYLDLEEHGVKCFLFLKFGGEAACRNPNENEAQFAQVKGQFCYRRHRYFYGILFMHLVAHV